MSRRRFLGAAVAVTATFSLPAAATAAVRRLSRQVRLGFIADLHQDVMHDGPARLEGFVRAMAARRPDALVQLGDFAYPDPKNGRVIEAFNRAHASALHVIGNHDLDAGHTKAQCREIWGMSGRYYARDVAGLRLLVLDGNDRGSPTHQGGYPSYVGEEQQQWLKAQLAALTGPAIVCSHQPLAGSDAVDNAESMQAILGAAADKVILAVNGHSHLDALHRIRGVTYLHVNSASYYWVGGDYQHASYPKSVLADHPWISHTCPYRDPLFALLTIDPQAGVIRVTGRASEWVGKSPIELGMDLSHKLQPGEEAAPRIRDRRIEFRTG